MSDEIKVHVVKRDGRKFLYMRFDNPLTGRTEWKSTGETKQKDAEKAAGKWEAELREGRYAKASSMTWAEFRDRYEAEVVASFKGSTAANVSTVFDALERICNPDLLRNLTAARLSYFQSHFRLGEPDKSGKPQYDPRTEATIKSYLTCLKAALSWAVQMEILSAVPKVKMPQRAKESKMMKGRPITAEEFDRMKMKIAAGLMSESSRTANKGTGKRKVNPLKQQERLARRQEQAAECEPSWKHLLEGLHTGGLRLDEAMNLWWNDDTKITVDLSGKHPMLRVRAELEKGNEDRMLPITPDFAEFLLRTPKAERTGPVFRPLLMNGKECRKTDHASKVISAIGRLANIKVDTKITPAGKTKIKYASAHDLRRAFGARWASRVMPAVLQQLMRHDSIDTTMKYYVGRDAQSTADATWEAYKRLQQPTGIGPSETHSKTS